MDLIIVLSDAKTQVLDEAAERLARSHLGHYDATSPEEQRRRMEALFEVIVESLKRRMLGPVIEYAERIAKDRFEDGFGIGEVQTAFNVLEESIWRQVTVTFAPPLASSVWQTVGVRQPPCSAAPRTCGGVAPDHRRTSRNTRHSCAAGTEGHRAR